MLGLPSLVSRISRELAGVDNEMEKEFDQFRSVYRSYCNYFYYRHKGKLKIFDLTYIWPVSEIPLRAAKTVMSGDLEGASSALNLFAHPLIDAVNILIKGKKPGWDVNLPQTDTAVQDVAQRIEEFIKYIWVPQSAPIPSLEHLMKELKIKPGPWTPYQVDRKSVV